MTASPPTAGSPSQLPPGVTESPLLALLGAPADPSAEVNERLAVFGPSALDEEDTLVLLLCHCGLTGALAASAAEALMMRFGGMGRIFGAPEYDLAQVIGVTASRRLGLLHGVLLRVLEHPLRKREVLSNTTAVHAYIRARLGALPREAFHCLFLDSHNQLIQEECLGQGSVSNAPVYPREVVRRALELSSSNLLLARCHPSGLPAPSQTDIEITRKISDAAKALGITVHDHFIVAGDQVTSLRARGLM